MAKTKTTYVSTVSSILAPVRSLTISKPSPKENVESSLRANIILVCKYAFKAENDNELTVSKGSILKLLDRPGNGWLLVKFVDRLEEPGLIPALYVDIAVNDQHNPVTLVWLQSSSKQYSQNDFIEEQKYLNMQFKSVSSPFLTINNRAFPTSVSISNFLLSEQRYWYRVDVVYSDHSKAYLCRYYQDFYNLHIKLLGLMAASLQIVSEELKLPKLPEPLPTNHDVEDSSQITSLLKRCNALNIYVNKLILNKYYQTSQVLLNWLDLNYDDLPSFALPTDAEVMTNDQINEKILPNSINVVKEYYRKEEVAESQAKLPQRTKSKNIYNNYQQARVPPSSATRLLSTKSDGAKRTPSTSNTSKNNISKNSISAPLVANQSYANGSNDNYSHAITPNQYSHGSNFNTSQPNANQPNASNNKANSYSNGKNGSSYVNSANTSVQDTSYANNSVNTSMNSSSSTPTNVQPPQMATTPQFRKTNSPGYNSPSYKHKISPPKNTHSPYVSNSPTYPHIPLSNNSPEVKYGQTLPPLPQELLSHSVSRNLFIKCKIVNFNNEIVALKLNKQSIKSINDLKVLIKQKIYFTKLFIKLPNLNNYESIDNVNFNINEFLRFNDKVMLKIS